MPCELLIKGARRQLVTPHSSACGTRMLCFKQFAALTICHTQSPGLKIYTDNNSSLAPWKA
jgi:hypothetical protein